MTRKVLMISFHYPPVAGSSGYQRVLNFAQHLPKHGWEPTILTVHPRAYLAVDATYSRRANDPEVIRAWALDAARHLSLGGKYPGFLARPDRWSSWWLGAVVGARGAVRRLRPDVVWSTYPISTAHTIGRAWQRRLGVPWIADFRDPMTADNYPDPVAGRMARSIERETVTHAARCIVTTPGALRLYKEWYPEVPADRFVWIPNGFDAGAFESAEKIARLPPPGRRPLRLVHSGTLYPVERDPTALFAALASLKRAGSISSATLKVVLRATGYDAQLRSALLTAGIEDLVELAPGVSYQDALVELLEADALLLMQGSICNNQIPAKVYEYLRANRPILALTDPAGDTAAVLRACGAGETTALDDAAAIEKSVLTLLNAKLPVSLHEISREAARFDRRQGAQELAAVLDEACTQRGCAK